MYVFVNPRLLQQIKEMHKNHKLKEISVLLNVNLAHVQYSSRLIKRQDNTEKRLDDFEELMIRLFTD